MKKKVMITNTLVEKLTEAGARRWTKYGRDRLYMTPEAIGMDYATYKSSGRCSCAKLDGEEISNSRGEHIRYLMDGCFIDLIASEVVTSHYRDSDEEEAMEYILRAIKHMAADEGAAMDALALAE